MGLDWIVNFYKRGTMEQVNEKEVDVKYNGVDYIRGAEVVAMLEKYVGEDEELVYNCYGEDEYDEEDNLRGPFMYCESTLGNIYDALSDEDLEEFEEMTVEYQKELIETVGKMYNDVSEYNRNYDNENEIKIYTWY